MITADFYLKNERFIGFSVRGHAGFAESGRDIVCAAVSSAVELTANGITEILHMDAAVDVFENEVKLLLPDTQNQTAVQFLQALRLQMELIGEEYSGRLRLLDMEV